MYRKINYSPYYYLNSRHLNLLDFGLKIDEKIQDKKQLKTSKNQNKLLSFIELTFNYVNWIFPKYSCDYSNHIYNQPQFIHNFSNKNLLKNNI